MDEDRKLSILEHLNELRGRLIKSIIAISITTAISFIFAKQIFSILTFPAQGINLVYIEMTEMIGTYMRLCFTSGIILAMPYLVYQLLIFVSPGLAPKEKKAVYLILPWIALMFAGGVIFAYFILVPPATRFLTSFGNDIATPQIRIGNYISIVSRLLLAVGFAFEIPVITTFLARLGVITPRWLSDKRKPAIIFAFILAAIITPTFDPLNQTLVAAPLIVLYEMSIGLAKIAARRRPQSVPSLASSVPRD